MQFMVEHHGRAATRQASDPAAVRRALRPLCLLAAIIIGLCATACRQDMQDQPKYKMYRESTFFDDRAAVRPLPEHTIPRGYLREDRQFYTGRSRSAASAAGSTTAPGTAASAATQGTATQGAATQGAATQGAATQGAATQGAAAQGAASFEPDLATAIPFPLTREVLDRGQNEFQTFCIVCHGPTGEGDGMVVRRGYRAPTSYHTDRLRAAPVGHFFDVITNGWGAMPSYGYLVTPSDRWAIAAYIRALQLSRSAKLEDLPAAERQRLASQIQTQPAASPSPAQTPTSKGRTQR